MTVLTVILYLFASTQISCINILLILFQNVQVVEAQYRVSVLKLHTGRNLHDIAVDRSNIQSGRTRRFFKIYSVKCKKSSQIKREFYEKNFKMVKMSIRYIRIYIVTVYLVTKK